MTKSLEINLQTDILDDLNETIVYNYRPITRGNISIHNREEIIIFVHRPNKSNYLEALIKPEFEDRGSSIPGRSH